MENSIFPKDIYIEIFFHADTRTILKLTQTCKELQQLYDNERLWKIKYEKDYDEKRMKWWNCQANYKMRILIPDNYNYDYIYLMGKFRPYLSKTRIIKPIIFYSVFNDKFETKSYHLFLSEDIAKEYSDDNYSNVCMFILKGPLKPNDHIFLYKYGDNPELKSCINTTLDNYYIKILFKNPFSIFNIVGITCGFPKEVEYKQISRVNTNKSFKPRRK